jgi:hypothetical protein
MPAKIPDANARSRPSVKAGAPRRDGEPRQAKTMAMTDQTRGRVHRTLRDGLSKKQA